MKKNKNLWFKEYFSPYESHSHKLKKIIVNKKTKYQKAIIADSFSFGRTLILDGEMQSAENDEFIYHETLVHPALITHDNPRDVLILGGGEGATLREVLKHKSVEKAVMVDIDEEIINFSKVYLKEWHRGSFDNPKAKILIKDGRDYILTTNEKFDVIISDLPSPLKEGPAYLLYTIEFYRELIKRLKKGGIFTLQAGSGSTVQIKVHSCIYVTLKRIFPILRPYYAYVPSFDVPWAFIMCSFDKDPKKISSNKIEKRIKERINGKLFFYDSETHIGLFHIPKYLRNILNSEKQIFTSKKPAFLYK